MQKVVVCLGMLYQLSLSADAQSKTTLKSSLQKDQTVVEAATHRNIIKIAPVGFISGVYPILYERKLTNAFSVQVGTGITGYNYVRGFINTTGDDISVHYTYWPLNTSHYNDNAGGPLNLNPRKATIGYLFTLQPRWYFTGKAINGLYLSAAYDYYRYNLKTPKGEPNMNNSGTMQKEHENITDFLLNVGYQKMFRHLSFELSLGAGYRTVEGTKYVVYNQRDGIAKYNDNGLLINVGFKAGYHF